MAKRTFYVKISTPIKDIESYLNNYRGNILIQRLQFIVERSESQRIDALRVGIRAAKKTLNIDAYIEFHEQLTSLGTILYSLIHSIPNFQLGQRPQARKTMSGFIIHGKVH